MLNHMPFIVGVGEVQRGFSKVLGRMTARGGEGIVVSHNEPRAVILSLARYEALRRLEDLRLEEEEDVLASIAQGDQEYNAGKTVKKKSLRALL